MKNEQEFETLLREALGQGARSAPFTVDVADRVMARVLQLGRPERARFDIRQFAAWAVAASVGGAALVTAAVRQGPTVSEAGLRVGHAVAGTMDAALKLATPAHTLAGALGRVGLTLLASAEAVVRPLVPLQPIAHLTLALVLLVMFGTTGWVVGRDVRARIALKEHA